MVLDRNLIFSTVLLDLFEIINTKLIVASWARKGKIKDFRYLSYLFIYSTEPGWNSAPISSWFTVDNKHSHWLLTPCPGQPPKTKSRSHHCIPHYTFMRITKMVTRAMSAQLQHETNSQFTFTASDEEEDIPSRCYLKRQAQLIVDTKCRRKGLRGFPRK